MNDRLSSANPAYARRLLLVSTALVFRTFLYTVLVLITFITTCRGAEQTAATLQSFADHLFEQGDYYRAITEYERVQFLYPDTPEAKTARFQIARCYFQSEQYTQALERFRGIAMDLPGDPLGERSQLLLAECYYRRGEYQQAIDALTGFLASYPKSANSDAARIKLGWCYLRQGNWTRASEEFRKLPSDSPLANQAYTLADGALRYPDVRRKSPRLAGMLAIVPGAGHLYIDRPGEALGSFLLNGLFTWGAIETYQHGNHVAAGILAFFELGWYSGNISTAISGARAYNRKEEKKYFDRMESQYGIVFSAVPGRGLTAALQLRF